MHRFGNTSGRLLSRIIDCAYIILYKFDIAFNRNIFPSRYTGSWKIFRSIPPRKWLCISVQHCSRLRALLCVLRHFSGLLWNNYVSKSFADAIKYRKRVLVRAYVRISRGDKFNRARNSPQRGSALRVCRVLRSRTSIRIVQSNSLTSSISWWSLVTVSARRYP